MLEEAHQNNQKGSPLDKIWLSQYEPGVPHTINPDAYSSLVHLFEESCAKFANHDAFSNMGTTITYQTLNEASMAMAAYFQQKLGMQPGDKLGIMLPNVLQFPITMFGALRAGLIVTNINPLYTADELAHQLTDAGVSTLVVLDNVAHTVERALPRMGCLKNIILTRVGDLFPWWKGALVNCVMKLKKMVPAYELPDVIHFKDALAQGEGLALSPPTIKGEAIAFLQYTGGTTGVAKGAMLTHRNLVANLVQMRAWIKKTILEGEEIVITALPLYHIFSLTANCLLFMELGGHNVLITNPRDMKRFLKTIAGYPFTVMVGVNTLFNSMLHHAEIHNINFDPLKITIGGGMAVQKNVAEAWERLTHSPLLEGYGLTESSPVVSVNPLHHPDYNGSVGLPLPSTEIQIRNEAGEALNIGEIGELWVRGPQVMKGYWNRDDETEKVLQDGWLATGDMAMVDETGFIKIVDRKKDMILVSGFNVYPTEVENVIAAHPAVVEVGVIGVENAETGGEMVKAYIVPEDDSLTKEAIVKHCKAHLTGYKIPKVVEFVDVLPKSNVGKILRRHLRDKQ